MKKTPDLRHLPPDVTPADIARAIVHLRARGKHAEADYLKAHLPPSLIHHGQPGPEPSFSPNGAAPAAGGPSTALSPYGVPHPENSASEGSLPPRIDKAYEVFGKPAAEPEPHKYGCVFLHLPEAVADRIIMLGKMIPEGDLADSGREPEAHLTLLYGL